MPEQPDVTTRVLALLSEGEECMRQGAGQVGLATVRRAWQLASEAGDTRLLAWTCSRLGAACETMGQQDEAVRVTRDAASLFESCHEPREAAIALYCLAYRELKAGLPQQAHETGLRAVRMARDLEAHEQEGHALVNLGHVSFELGSLDEAEEHYVLARRAFERARNPGGVAASQNSLAGVLRARGDVEGALALHREALDTARRAETWSACFDALMNLGELEFGLGQLPSAQERFADAIEQARRLGLPLREVMAKRNLAVVQEVQGHLEEALCIYLEVHATLQALEDEAGCAEMLRLYINACKRTSHPERGLVWRRRALGLARAHLSLDVVLELLDNVAEIAFHLHRWSLALDYWENAQRLARRLGQRERELTCLEHLRYIYQQRGRADLALEPAQELATLYHEAGDTAEHLRSLVQLAEIWLALSEPLMALGVTRKGLGLLEEASHQDSRLEAGLRGNLANALFLLGSVEEAVEQYEQALALFRLHGDASGEKVTLANLGTAWRTLGDNERAARCSAEGVQCLAPASP